MADTIGNNRILVYLRIRPPTDEERTWFSSNEYPPLLLDANSEADPDHRITLEGSGKPYNFDRVFREWSTQDQIFKEVVLGTLTGAFEGFCGAVMAYGQTGTGKTHTIQGLMDHLTEQGIIPRMSRQVFMEAQSRMATTNITITISFVQIYLDKLQDLFNTSAPEITINPDTERVELPGITTIEVHSAEELLQYFRRGEANRVVRATKMNPVSSRGHAALIVNVKSEPRVHDGTQGVKIGKIVVVDLAGYERFAQTGIESGIAVEEAKKINASLLSLGSVVNALASESKAGQKSHIPYRNAKLTRLLKDCLGGTSRTTIICTMGPCSKYKQETSGTLHFGFRARAVKVDATVRAVYDPKKYAETLKSLLSDAQARLTLMASWWNVTQRNEYNACIGAITAESGAEFGGITLLEDDELRIRMGNHVPCISGSGGQVSERRPAPAPSRQAAVFSEPVPTPRPARSAEEGPDEDGVLRAVHNVQREYQEELGFYDQQSEQELDQLLARHAEELEYVVARGGTREQLARLAAEQQEEIDLHRRQMQEGRVNLLMAREKEELHVMFSQAMRDFLSTESPTPQETHRVEYITTFLQSTCSSKDEVVAALLQLVIKHERELAHHGHAAGHARGVEENDMVVGLRLQLKDLEEALDDANRRMDRMKAALRERSIPSTTPPRPAHPTTQQNAPMYGQADTYGGGSAEWQQWPADARNNTNNNTNSNQFGTQSSSVDYSNSMSAPYQQSSNSSGQIGGAPIVFRSSGSGSVPDRYNGRN